MTATSTKKASETMNAPSAKKKSITIERSFTASIDEVWELWTTKDGFESWWGPEGFGVDVHELDVKSGGHVRYTMKATEPATIAFMKEQGMPAANEAGFQVVEVVEKKRIVIRHVVDFVPGVAKYETDQTVDFVVKGREVTMRITVEAMHDEAWTQRMSDGWSSQLTKLAKKWAARAAH